MTSTILLIATHAAAFVLGLFIGVLIAALMTAGKTEDDDGQ